MSFPWDYLTQVRGFFEHFFSSVGEIYGDPHPGYGV